MVGEIQFIQIRICELQGELYCVSWLYGDVDAV